jgi:hypothetical protein
VARLFVNDRTNPAAAPAQAIKNSLDRLVLQGGSVDAVVKQADAEIQEALTRYAEDNS